MSINWRTIDPALLEPTFRRDVETLLANSPHHWTVTSGYRSLAEQRVLRAKYEAGGPLAARPGASAHNYGLAIDVVPDANPAVPGLQPTWDTSHPAWQWLRDACRPHPRLQHGSRFGDWPHIQRYRWKQHTRWTDTRLHAA